MITNSMRTKAEELLQQATQHERVDLGTLEKLCREIVFSPETVPTVLTIKGMGWPCHSFLSIEIFRKLNTIIVNHEPKHVDVCLAFDGVYMRHRGSTELIGRVTWAEIYKMARRKVKVR